ncbi:hypothetical protein B9Z55_013271 [Caenorhabditis nigoni]|uniref:Cyclin N-terminal domain-containing protein n=1 Tax=Caenorhabditis nigoni TaxID=1611254 RepID=A0A2G5U0Y8_9PELO|nr:hypothetical protein B9Z55_013271 [Caenorhabditis nigoni]
MNRRKAGEPPNFLTRTSLETLLTNSESPSFVVFRKTSQSTRYEQPEQDLTGLVIRDGQKRPKPISPIAPASPTYPAAKRVKNETVSNDFHSHIKLNETRLKAVAGANVDIYEMYAGLCKSVVPIPVPHSLLQDNDPSEVTNNTVCSIEDRKRALLQVFSRRFKLNISDETLHLGAALLDKCLDLMAVDKEKLEELAAVTLIVASKIEDVMCLTIGNVIEFDLVKNRSIAMLASLERFVLASLAFNVTIPTPFNFATYMLLHLHASQTTIYSTYYFLELSLLYVHNRCFSSDVVAYSATCLAVCMEANTGTSVARLLRDTELKLRIFADKDYQTKREQSREIMRTLSDLFLVASDEKHAIFREYSSSRRDYVAMRRLAPDLLETLRVNSSSLIS